MVSPDFGRWSSERLSSFLASSLKTLAPTHFLLIRHSYYPTAQSFQRLIKVATLSEISSFPKKLIKIHKWMFSCNLPNRPMKQLWLVESLIVRANRSREGFQCLLKEAFHYTVTSFILFGKSAYFTHKGSSHSLHSDSSASPEIPSISASSAAEMTPPWSALDWTHNQLWNWIYLLCIHLFFLSATDKSLVSIHQA